MAQWELAEDAVNVASALALPFQHASSFKLGDDFLNRALGDADLRADVAEAHFWVLGEAQQDVGMIGEKGPTSGFWTRGNGFFHFRN